MILPSLKQMRYLVALRDHGSFSKAAEICFVTQSTLSAGIKEMEEILGHQLVDRSRKKAELTPLGAEMAQEAEQILTRAERMEERARQLDAPMAGPLRLGVIPTIAPYLLPDILPRMQKLYPLLELHIHEDMSARLVEKAAQGLLDLILLAFPYDTPGMEQMNLFEEPFWLACAKGQKPDTREINTSDLEPDRLLLLEDGHCLRDHALKACDLQTPQKKQKFSASSLPTLLQLVAAGYGMTLLPDMAAAKKLIPPGVKILPFADPKPTREIGIAWRRGSARSKDFEALGHIIRNPE